MLSRVNKACREGVSDLVGESRTRLSVRHHVVSKERLKWARENGCPWGGGVCSAAARGGHLEVLQYARANECPWDEDTCSSAAVKAIWMCCSGPGQTDALGKKARAQPLPVEAIWMCCSGPGQTDVRGMKARAEPLPVEAIWMCCSGPGQTDALGMKARVCFAAHGGHLEVLQWARANGCPWDETTCEAAVARGHLDVVQWAKENDCPGAVQFSSG